MSKRYSEKFVNMVEDILSKNEKARNDDVYGTLLIWTNYYKDKIIETGQGKAILLKTILDLPNMEGFKRIRAKFNETGRYLPTDPQVIKKRRLQKSVVLNTIQKI